MSASEKLRALDQAMGGIISISSTDDSHGLSACVKAISDLAAALPKIVAVVEAAEIVDECADSLEEDGYKYLSPRAALADLEEALSVEA